MVSYQNHRANMGTNPNFDTNAPPFEQRGCKLLYYALISIPIVNFELLLRSK